MTNNHHSKSTPDDEESYTSNHQQRRRIHLNQSDDENPSRQASSPSTTLDDAALRQRRSPNVMTPTHQVILHRPLNIESIFGSVSLLRNGNGSTDASTGRSAPLSHQQLMHFLDRALEICDECFDDMDMVENQPDLS